MKFNLFFIFIISCFNTFIYGDTLHIYLNTSTCRSCNLVGKQIEDYKTLKKILYLSESDFKIKEEILESLNLEQGLYEVCKLEKHIFYPKNRSFMIFQRGKFRSDSFLLGDSGKLGVFIFGGSQNQDLSKNPIIKRVRRLTLDERIKLSDDVVASVDGSNLLFFDSKLNKAILSKIRNDSIILLETYKASNFHIEEFEKCKCFDEKLYEHLLPILTQLNLTKPSLDAVYFKDSLLHLMVGLEVGILSKKNTDTVIGKKLFVYTINIEKKIGTLTCINSDGSFETDNVLGSKFGVVNVPFIRSVDTLYTPIVSNDSIKKSLFVKQVIIGKQIKNLGITRDLGGLVPKDFKFTFGTQGVFLSRGVNGSDYFFIKAPLIYNISSKKTFFINNPLLVGRLKLEKTYITDCQIDNGKAKFLLKEGDVWYQEEYSVVNNQLLTSKVIETSAENNFILFLKDTDSFFMGSTIKSEFYIYD